MLLLPAWANCADWSMCGENTGYLYTAGVRWAWDTPGTVTSYPSAGYQVLLSTATGAAQGQIEQLRSGHWLDNRSRALQLELVTFNANTRLFTQVHS